MQQKYTGIIYIISFIIFPWLVLSPAVNLPASIPLRLGIFGVLSLGGALLFHLTWPRQSWGTSIVFTLLGYGTVYKLATFIPDISTYPFSLGWSEASRYYYASLWLSKQVYGQFIPPSVLHPSRYLLQAIPFLFAGSSLWLSRIWQVFLWVSTSSLTSWLLIRRLDLSKRKTPLVITLSMALWGFLFIFQGPVYYHLLLMVILILWGFDSRRFWRSLVLVLIASIWAGISRVNWLPVPGLLAAALYLMQEKFQDKPLWRYLFPPAIWVVAGTGAAFATQQAYQAYSGNPVAWFGSSLTSDLLWYRLLPNRTYSLGILPSAILVSIPLLGLIGLRLIKRWRDFHFTRLFGLTAILLVLFMGGVIVSVKIGGGSNLHNLDAYLMLLLVIGSYIYFDRFLPDQPNQVDAKTQQRLTLAASNLTRSMEAILITAALVIPLYFTLSTGGQPPKRDFQTAQAAVNTINVATQQAAALGGEVLFISQRQLETFDYVQKVPLVPEGELVFLMEMAMSDNKAYLDAFQADISSHRFAMIVSEPLVIQYQGRSHAFGEENDAWVKRVSEPILCYYEPSVTLDSVGVVLYTPRSNPCK